MAAQRREDGIQEQGGTGMAVRRRGLIAGAAAAVVAGIVAKQTAQPVAASSGGGNQGPLTLGSNPWYRAGIDNNNSAAVANASTVINASGDFGTFAGANGAEYVVFEVNASTATTGGSLVGFSGIGRLGGTGVNGYSATGAGVGGVSASGQGVTGYSATGEGVYGTSTNGTGVYGYANSSVGVNGVVGKGTTLTAIGVGDVGVRGESNTTAGSGVFGTTTGYHGVYGYHPASGDGVRGLAETGIGIFGSTTSGAVGVRGQTDGSGLGMSGESASGIGGSFTGGIAPLLLVPATSGTGSPTTGAHKAGELFVDSSGSLFFCKTSGTPGTWIPLGVSAAAGGGVTGITAPGGTATGNVTLAAGPNVTIAEAANTITISAAVPTPASLPTLHVLPTPERFVDTRIGLGGVQGPLPATTTHTFAMTGRAGLSGNPTLIIPDAATIIVGNLTVIGGAGIPVGSFITLWPGGAQPTVSNINYGPGGVIANSYVVGLTSVGGHGTVSVYNLSACDYILDVTGYYLSTASASDAKKP